MLSNGLNLYSPHVLIPLYAPKPDSICEGPFFWVGHARLLKNVLFLAFARLSVPRLVLGPVVEECCERCLNKHCFEIACASRQKTV